MKRKDCLNENLKNIVSEEEVEAIHSFYENDEVSRSIAGVKDV